MEGSDGGAPDSGAGDAGAESCEQGDERFDACGLNGRGRERFVCYSGWRSDGCDDSDECVDDGEQVEPCGRNMRGMATRRCVAGRWGAPSCDDPDECTDGMTQNRVCQSIFIEARDCLRGRWSDWAGCGCEDDAARGRVCGFNDRGEQRQTCQNGVWSAWSACEDPDECVDDTIDDRTCDRGRVEQRECIIGEWSAWGDCVERPEE